MSIVNRRNAVLGWATWAVGKRLIAKKAKAVIPSRDVEEPKDRKRAVKVIALVVAAGGALVFWKAKHRDSTDHDSIASEEIGTPDE
jgi:hypothetical protein